MTGPIDLRYAQGFIATRASDVHAPAHFVERGRIGGYTVLQDERVPFEWVERDGFRCLVLGFAGVVGQQPERTLSDAVSAAHATDGVRGVSRALESAVGRWAIIMGTDAGVHVYHDAIGARSVFYAVDGSCVASHVGLVAENHPDAAVRRADRRQVSSDYALDLTELDAVRALLPNFLLDVTEVSVERIYPTTRNSHEGLSVDALLERIERLWLDGCRWALQLPYRHLAPLTGGLDSRLLAAMQHGEREDLHYFTYRIDDARGESDFTVRAWDEDVRVGAAIAEQLGLPHRVIAATAGSAPNDVREALLASSPLGHGADLAARYLDEYGQMTTVLHRSSALEIGREYFASRAFTGSRVAEVRQLLDSELSKAPDADARPESPSQLADRYLSSMGLRRAGELGYPLTSLVYWELRCGRFHSDVLTGLDAAFVPINGFSSRALWDAILALPAELRRQDWLHWKLIARRAPAMLGFPVNGVPVMERCIDAAMGATRTGAAELRPITMRAGTMHGVTRTLDSAHDDVLFIPAHDLAEIGWAEASVVVDAVQCGMEIEFRTPYALGRASGALSVELLLNDEPLASEDIGFSSERVRARVIGLRRGDRVALRVSAQHALPSSWERASRLEIERWTLTNHRADFTEHVQVGWSSPWGSLTREDER